ncbi:class I SAM-dependent methyltransferase [Polyangium aurulentum]|uniref:class I SAM-dependent methyltransferase n=1 Tax=Polyangium aurulentum TaxID=2567896 RepID=UPI0010ADC82C|nr:class I SAM-dependent methyltransferase [Polyangium aurulentum]UQA55982.1 class I SAM-dependent methyltransferase [Polyangium aurulentum]
MKENPAASDWAAARGEKWCAQLSGMESMLMPIDEPLIGALKLDAPSRIAEVGCGGGGTALEILRRAPAGSVVHGFDISPKLIEQARGRLRPDERAIVFEVADMATAAPERPYDRLVSRLGVMFFDDPPAAFANLVRWLEPGGRFAFAVWGRPSDNPWMTSLREVVARVIALPQTDPEAPGPFRYADASKLLSLLDRAGFSELEVHDWRGALPIGGELAPPEAAHFALASFSSFGELLASAGDDAFREAHQSLTTCFSRHQQDGAVRMDACVRIFTGARP